MSISVPTCCFYCGDDVDPDAPTTYRRCVGWERKASSSTRRGGSDIVLREPGVGFACQFCVANLKNGRPATQGGMF